MARVSADDVAKWVQIIAPLIPVVGNAASAVIEIFRLVRRSTGQPEAQPGDDLIVAEVVAALDRAQTPWERVRDRAEGELSK